MRSGRRSILIGLVPLALGALLTVGAAPSLASDDSWGTPIDLNPYEPPASNWDRPTASSNDGRVILTAWGENVSVTRDGGNRWPGYTSPFDIEVGDLTTSADGSESVLMVAEDVSGGITRQIKAAASGDFGATWSSPVQIGLPSNWVSEIDLVSSADGQKVFGVWSSQPDPDAGPVVNAVRSSDGGITWSQPTQLSLDSEQVGDGPRVVMSADGHSVTVVWERVDAPWYGTIRAITSLDGGSNWSPQSNVSDPMPAGVTLKDLQASDDGANVTAAWTTPGTLWVARSEDGGATWSTPTAVATSVDPIHSAVLRQSADADELRLLWKWGTGLWFATSSDAGSSWSTPVQPWPGIAANEPRLTASADGTSLTSVWEQDQEIHASQSVDGGQTWTTPTVISTTYWNAETPTLVASNDGFRVAAIWKENGIRAATGPAPRLTTNAVPGLGNDLVLYFGDQPKGESTPRALTVTNSGNRDLRVSQTEVQGQDAQLFGVTSDSCLNTVLQPGGECEVEVTFSPSGAGEKDAELQIAANTGQGVHKINLVGRGTVPEFDIDPISLSFGDLLQGDTAEELLTVTNTGQAPLQVSDVAVEGTDPSDFLVAQESCTAVSVVPGGTCTLTVRFSPGSLGPKAARLALTHNAAPDATQVDLTGTGTAPAIGLSTSSVSYGEVTVGGGKLVTVTISNPGTAPLHVTDFSLSGKDADQFALGGQNCKSSAVPASGDCWVEVRFVPTRAGSHAAAVTISSDATSGPDTISLSGLGTSPATPPQPTNPPFVPTQPAPPVGGPTTSPVALTQTASTPPRSVRVKRSAPLPTRTAQGSPISWKSQSPRVCKVRRNTVKGLKKGTCTLGASAPGSAALAPWSNRYRVRVR